MDLHLYGSRASHNGVTSPCYVIGGLDRMDNDETHLAQQQQVDISGFVSGAISAVLLVVLVVWGIRQVVRGIKGEPIEQAPL